VTQLRRSSAVVGLAAALIAAPRDRMGAQVAAHVAAGIRVSSALVHDSIVTALDVTPALAPVVSASLELAPRGGQRWSGTVVADVSWSGLTRHEAGGGPVALGNLTALSVSVGLRRTWPAGFATRVSAGGLGYVPARRTGLFRDGGGVFPLFGLAVAFTPPARRVLGLELRYDVHGFTTRALEDAGFAGRRPVHRVALVARADLGVLR
jgi:hypothetical protein